MSERHANRLRLLATVLTAALVPALASAQASCRATETFEACWERYLDRPNLESTTDAAKAQEKKNQESTTKAAVRDVTESPDTNGESLATSKKSFLPRLALSGLLGNGQKDGNNESFLVFDLNFLLPMSSKKGNNSQLQMAVNTAPSLAGAFAEKLPEMGRADKVTAIEKTIGDADDYAISYSYNWQRLNAGRDFSDYSRRFAALVDAAQAPINPTGGGRLLTELTGRANLLSFQVPNDDPLQLTTSAIRKALVQEGKGAEDAREEAEELTALLEKAIDAELGVRAELEAANKKAGLDKFASLLDNQPQFILGIDHKFRDDLVGGDSWSGELRWELTKINLKNSMPKECHEDLQSEDKAKSTLARAESCLESYTRYVSENEDKIGLGNRFSLAIEYSKVDEVSVLPALLNLDTTDPVVIPEDEKIIASFGMSRNFNNDTEPVVADFATKYEFVSDNEMRQERWTASLTLTRKIAGITVPFGVVWANRGEYLGMVDERLSAHVGLKFDVFGKEKELP